MGKFIVYSDVNVRFVDDEGDTVALVVNSDGPLPPLIDKVKFLFPEEFKGRNTREEHTDQCEADCTHQFGVLHACKYNRHYISVRVYSVSYIAIQT